MRGENGSVPKHHAVRVVQVDWDDPRAVALRSAMDAELVPRYASRMRAAAPTPERAARASADFAVDPADVVATILAVAADDTVLGHATLRRNRDDLEVKRVFVPEHARGGGVARALMAALESIAIVQGARRVILQTGELQPDAIALYERIGYSPIPIFAPYLDYPFSRCFEKVLTTPAHSDD